MKPQAPTAKELVAEIVKLAKAVGWNEAMAEEGYTYKGQDAERIESERALLADAEKKAIHYLARGVGDRAKLRRPIRLLLPDTPATIEVLSELVDTLKESIDYARASRRRDLVATFLQLRAECKRYKDEAAAIQRSGAVKVKRTKKRAKTIPNSALTVIENPGPPSRPDDGYDE